MAVISLLDSVDGLFDHEMGFQPFGYSMDNSQAGPFELGALLNEVPCLTGPDPLPVSNHHSNPISSLPRTRVATQAMLEANARRRAHPAQFECSECGQKFTAQFSLKREFSNEVLLLSLF